MARRLSTAAEFARKTFQQLIHDEPTEAKRYKLEFLQALWDQQVTDTENLEVSMDAQIKATERQSKAREQLDSAHTVAVAISERTQVLLTHELLLAKGLNSTRGLFEYLQEKIYAKDPTTAGKRASEHMWRRILQLQPELVSCLRAHLPHENLASHLAEIYTIMSQRVHDEKHLSQKASKIIFEGDFLSVQQRMSIECMGRAVGIVLKPAAPRDICDRV